MNHNWSATKQRLHPQIVAEISHHSVLSGDRIRQCETSSGSRHKDRSVSVSRHFLLQAPQCFCSVRKRFSRDHCCRGRSTCEPHLAFSYSHCPIFTKHGEMTDADKGNKSTIFLAEIRIWQTSGYGVESQITSD